MAQRIDVQAIVIGSAIATVVSVVVTLVLERAFRARQLQENERTRRLLLQVSENQTIPLS